MNPRDKYQDIIQSGGPSDWFEPLYADANPDGHGVPWAHMDTHPVLRDWLTTKPIDGTGKSALVVGCGMGDDAVALAALGFRVTAFDVSATAIEYCQQRFPDSDVTFVQADLLVDQTRWTGAFDFVLEIYTVQALPPTYEDDVIRRIAAFVAPGGQLLVITKVRDAPRDLADGPPWVLTMEHIDAFAACGLEVSDQVLKPTADRQAKQRTCATLFQRDPYHRDTP